MIKIFIIVLLVLLEIPFFLKFQKAHQNFEIIRETAIVIIMAIIGLLIFGLTKI